MRFVLILLITYLSTSLATPVQDEITNLADFIPPTDSSIQVVSGEHGNLALSEDLFAADSQSIRASPSLPPNPAIPSSPSIAANPLIAANPSDPTTASKQNSPSDQTKPPNSVQKASSPRRKGDCSPGSTQTTGKARRGEACTYSWEDDPTSREDFICPIWYHLLCCVGPIWKFIFTLGCIEYTNADDPRCGPWHIRCCLEYQLALQEPGSDTGQDPQWVGELCYKPLWFGFP